MSGAELRPHEFDGIQEFDNRLPNWWLWTFYLSCIFSVGYWIHYHTLGTGALPYEAYEIEQAEAAARLEAELAKNPVSDESLQRLASEPAAVALGRDAFLVHCVMCHHTDGTASPETPGGAFRPGVNLTDDWWLNGDAPMDIYRTISEGAENGMQSWKHLGRSEVTRLTAYVMAELKGKDRPGKPLTDAEQERALRTGEGN